MPTRSAGNGRIQIVAEAPAVYMSPEQIMTATVSGKADQYSLGVIAYQMLSGRKLFAADTGPALTLRPD